VAHQSLYRTYRPQCFEDVVGQSHVTRTLRNAVAENQVAHAYLFTGPRGTGKTTTARILAKALNCEKGPTPDFDDSCQNCVEITEGRHPDVYELDAASRTGVDAIRDEIINKVSYAATRGGFKVYIIDEVHMLSTSAFNALLKTLEEPPPKTVFVLCTTHPNKVPETIHSRCQRFDFRRISTEDIVERLQLIADAEKIAVAPGSLTLIAKHAAGGMRDAISTLDQLAAFTGKSISIDDVEGLLGEVDATLLFEVADDIARRDIAECFRFVAKLAEAGVDVTEFVKSLIGHFRDMFVIATVRDAAGIVDQTDENLAKLSAQAAEFGRERLARLLDVLGQLSSDLRWSGDSRLALEVALVRMARPQGDLTLEALEERIVALEAGSPVSGRSSAPGAPTAPAAPAGRAAPAAAPARAAAPAPAPSAAPRPTAPAPVASAAPAPARVEPAAPAPAEAPAPQRAAAPVLDPGLSSALADRIAKRQAAIDSGADTDVAPAPEPEPADTYAPERHAAVPDEDAVAVAPETAQAFRAAAAAALAPAPEKPAEPEATATAEAPAGEAPAAAAAARPAASGPLDRAQLKRAWPAVVAEIKKAKNATGQLFVTAAVDTDGDEIVVEFPADQELTMKMAQRPDNLQYLRQALATVLGKPTPVRYQLGRGTLKPAEAARPANVIHHMPDPDAPPPPPEPDALDLLAGEFGDIEVEHVQDTDGEGPDE
jgi:DNA polymerase III subunit gamma/tau